MAGDAELSLRVLHGGAQGDRAAPRRVGKPGVAHVDQEIHACAHCLVRILIRRHAVFIGVQLVSRMIGGYPHVVLLPRLKDASAEFVQSRIILGRFNLVNKFAVVEGDHIRLTVRVFAQLKDIHIERNVAIRHVQYEVDQLGLLFTEGESEPLEAFEHGVIGILALRGSIGSLIVAAKDRLAQFKGLRDLPGAIRRGGDDAAIEMWDTARRGGRGLQNPVHARDDLGNVNCRS